MQIRTRPLLSFARACAFVPAMLMACALPAQAQIPPNGNTVYQAKCSLCHDSGAGAAPRITHREEWTARLGQTRMALHEVAIKGKPGTAMAAKGGFAELSDAEVRAAVDFMLTRLEYKEVLASSGATSVGSNTASSAASSTASSTAVTSSAPADDAAIAEQIRAAYAASKGAVSTRVQVESSGGVVTLKGMVRDNEAVKRAEELARAVPGVKNVENKLVSAAVFQWD